MTACRIEFKGLSGNRMEGGLIARVQIDRRQPAALKPHIPDTKFARLCDKIDLELGPLNGDKRIYKYVSILGYFLAPFILGIPIGLLLLPDPDTTTDDGSMVMTFLVTCVVAGALSVLILSLSFCVYTAKVNLLMDREMKDVLQELSREYPELTFQLQQQQAKPLRGQRFNGSSKAALLYTHNYSILVSMESVRGFVASPYEHSPSTAAQLTELERLKGILSDEEYENKHKEILEASNV